MKKVTKRLIIIIALFILLLFLTYGFSLAKYVSNSVFNYYLKTKGFYMTSDYLSDNNTKNTDNVWDGEKVNFNLKNSLNNLTVTSYDINYKAECSVNGVTDDSVKCYMNGSKTSSFEGVLSSYEVCTNNTDDEADVTSLTKSECSSGGYEWKNGIAKKDLYFEVKNKDGSKVNDAIVNVVVTSTSPYKKEIKGQFSLHRKLNDNEMLKLKYESHDSYDILTISNPDSKSKSVRISFNPDNIRLDITNEVKTYTTDTNGYVNSFDVTIPEKSNLNYYFYKVDKSKVYSINNFSITELN